VGRRADYLAEYQVMKDEVQTGLLLDEIYEKHDTGIGHPETAGRVKAVNEKLKADGLVKKCKRLDYRRATDEEILLCHTSDYLKVVKREIDGKSKGQLSTGDTVFGAESLDVAEKAVGGVLNAVDAVMKGEVRNAFAVVRPPGHHANADTGMGFCIFNQVAIAARYVQKRYDLERVLIVDWDVHHGNGTQDIFYQDGSVAYFSTHQHPWYPGTGMAQETGEGKGGGTTINHPLPAGTGMVEIEAAFRESLLPKMAKFKPQMVLLSAGFDSRMGDPLGQFQLSDEDFIELTGIMLELAGEHCDGRLVSVLEGGYHLTGLASAAAAHLGALIGKQ
jgi:acetoin utilization deacetylase AcuC-like enzyme